MTSYHFDWQQHQGQLIKLFRELELAEELDKDKLAQVTNHYPKSPGHLFKKSELLQAYRHLAGSHGLKEKQAQILRLLRKKPIRTASGVTVVTVLTKPYPCPGQCIFCPNDIRMPKSYLADEPGAQRAEKNYFDPYLQTYNRLQALDQIGHNIDKVELIILGGTWSFYPEVYQRWFVKECFRAINEYGQKDSRPEILERYQAMNQELQTMSAHQISSEPEENEADLSQEKIEGKELTKTYNQVVSELYLKPEKMGGFDQYQQASWEELAREQRINETARQRSVGLVLETRPDNVTPQEVIRMRRLGATKIQLGFQSLNDEILAKNKRGHDVETIKQAVKLLRSAGFKIHAHWMPNLYGSNVEMDKEDYQKMFDQFEFRPDELKIYPCSLLESAELMQFYQTGRFKPYTHEELLEVLSYVLSHTPEYCRLTRVMRDIPSPDIVQGNKKTNFRQIAQQHLVKLGTEMKDIRAREIRYQEFEKDEVKLTVLSYRTSVGQEKFLQFVLPQAEEPAKIVAFLRLSLPDLNKNKPLVPELSQSAIIREIHVYGRAVKIGRDGQKKPQHAGFGTKLIKKAQEISQAEGYQQLAVISAVGTREYYRQKGFKDGELYQFMKL